MHPHTSALNIAFGRNEGLYGLEYGDCAVTGGLRQLINAGTVRTVSADTLDAAFKTSVAERNLQTQLLRSCEGTLVFESQSLQEQLAASNTYFELTSTGPSTLAIVAPLRGGSVDEVNLPSVYIVTLSWLIAPRRPHGV
jgi:hypothetical protein